MRNNVPGVWIPDEVVNRMKGAQKQVARRQEAGVELIQQVREIPGVSGVHVMAYRQEELVAEIIESAGLLPRRVKTGAVAAGRSRFPDELGRCRESRPFHDDSLAHHRRPLRVCGRPGGDSPRLRPAWPFAGCRRYRQKIIHARWSGEACWIPLGDFQLGSTTRPSFPGRGEVLSIRAGSAKPRSSSYGSARFASKVGQLAGNHFLTITGGRERLAELGRLCLWQGAQDIVFEAG